MATHLFVAPGGAAFGEVLLGLRLARELHARGDRVLFLAPAAHGLLFDGSPFSHGHIDKIAAVLDRALPDVIRQRGCDTVVLLDLLVTLLALGQHRIDPLFLDTLPVPALALDIWDLRASELRFDMCEAELRLPDAARHVVPRRLVPVPFARPSCAGAYSALPATTLFDVRARERTRAELGVGEHEHLVLLTTARFQARGLTPFQSRSVAVVPGHIARLCQDAGDSVRVLHIGPQPIADAGPRYRHQGQLPPADFERFVHAADLLVTPNQAATGITTALHLGVPTLCAVSSTADFPYRVFPLGLHGFMSPILKDNPYVDAVPAVELFPGDALVEAVRGLLFDEAKKSAAFARSQAYLHEVRALPTGAARFDELLGAFSG